MYFLCGDFKLVCLTEAILKAALSALNNSKGNNSTTNNSYADKWTHVGLLRANVFKRKWD